MLPDLKNIGAAELGGKGAGWVTLTPDSKTAYVANPVTNDVSVVDVKTMKETTRIPVGYVPKPTPLAFAIEGWRLEVEVRRLG
jgi:YVTN family beta-propeller protein